MRKLTALVLTTALLSLAGCYSSSESISAGDQATPAAVPQTSGPNNAVVPAPTPPAANAPANPDATSGSAAGTAPGPTAPEAAPAAQPPR